MSEQLEIFENVIPPCKHCGGVGRWEDAGLDAILTNLSLERLVCTKCTFQTDPCNVTSRKGSIRRWVKGVPCCVYDPHKKRTLFMNEYYKFFSRATPRPRIRFYGNVYSVVGW